MTIVNNLQLVPYQDILSKYRPARPAPEKGITPVSLSCNSSSQSTNTSFFSVSRIASNVQKIALPALILLGIASIPKAEGGLAEYMRCIQYCWSFVPTPVGIAGCSAGCAILLSTPSP